MLSEIEAHEGSVNDGLHSEANDNSNPQQGTGDSRITKYTTKIPPTARDDRKLFVGGLPPDVTEQEFRSFFSQFGDVLDSVVMFDRETRNSRGFGFVTFADPSVANSLLQNGERNDGVGRLTMRGKICEVKKAEPKSTFRASKQRGMFSFPSTGLFPHDNYIPVYAFNGQNPGVYGPPFYNFDHESSAYPMHGNIQHQPMPMHYMDNYTYQMPFQLISSEHYHGVTPEMSSIPPAAQAPLPSHRNASSHTNTMTPRVSGVNIDIDNTGKGGSQTIE